VPIQSTVDWMWFRIITQICSNSYFLAQDVIYTSRAYAMMSVSVCLSVTFVHCGHSVQWITDIFACLDRWMSLLLTNNASPGSSDGMMPGFLVEEGRGMEKLVILVMSLNLLTESLLDGWTGWFCLHVDIYRIF